MEYRIVGDVMQALQITLRQGEEVFGEAGSMLYMGRGIDLQAKMQGGVMKGLMRKFLAGESMFAGLFGGEGFILQRLSGHGLVFLQAGGNVLEFDLAPGEQMRVDTGCIVSMADTVSYDMQFVGGFRNALFGGEGLFYAVLTGPGHVTLQTLPFSRFANRIAAAMGGRSGESRGAGGLGGNILGDLISD